MTRRTYTRKERTTRPLKLAPSRCDHCGTTSDEARVDQRPFILLERTERILCLSCLIFLADGMFAQARGVARVLDTQRIEEQRRNAVVRKLSRRLNR